MLQPVTKLVDLESAVYEFRNVYKLLTQLIGRKYRPRQNVVTLSADSDQVVFMDEVVPDDLSATTFLIDGQESTGTWTKVSDTTAEYSSTLTAGTEITILTLLEILP